MSKKFFSEPTDINPRIYAYEDTNPQYKGLLKVGYTSVDVKKRVAQQYPTLRPGNLPYRILVDEPAMKNDGSIFSDHEVHKQLQKNGFIKEKGEWFRCSSEDVVKAINSIIYDNFQFENNLYKFSMRPEQLSAVNKTYKYFNDAKKNDPKKIPHFLWNAKMRFGKTFTTYQLAKKMKWKKVLILTFKPAVENSWEEDLVNHIDFKGWKFITHKNIKDLNRKSSDPVVCFGSFQNFLGKNKVGGIKPKNEIVHAINWDCVVFDEYHYGAWRERAKELFENEEKDENNFSIGEGMDYFDEDALPITTSHYLYLSGTPFRAISTGEFIEDQIFNWTYSDEQREKKNWKGKNNPYESMPQMVLMTYQLPKNLTEIIKGGEFDEFDLNTFFAAKGLGKNAKFTYESEVQKWLDLIRGEYLETSLDNLKLGAKKPPLPFKDTRLLGLLNHTLWLLPNVASCFAMKNLIDQKQNLFYQNYNIVVAAGSKAGIGVDALPPVRKAMVDPLKNKSITLTCQKLTTGVTVKPWSGIFMLRNTSSPEMYFQAAFRVQSPWTERNPDDKSPNQIEIIKKQCFIFDFALNRSLRLIADYSCRLNTDEDNPEKKVKEFINFLPVLAYDGMSMAQVDAANVLDIAMSGTSATLLAKRWESALLVNVDNDTLNRLMKNQKAMDALMSIEGFRSLNKEIESIINKSELIKKTKQEANKKDLSDKKRKELSDEEKEYKSLRKKVQEKLIKFATRVPIFMYLTDYRERSLKDIILKLEPDLFRKVTGLKVEDFELLISLNVFNSSIMNDAVYKFKRYEDSSLSYSGLNKHEKDKNVGLFDTSVSVKEFEILQ